MASAVELWDSGEGGYVSDRDGAGVSRRFRVTVDAPTANQREDPADFVLRSRALLNRSAVPLGDPHPSGYAKDRSGLYASRYTVEEHVAYLEYIVRVDYMPPIGFDFSRSTPWQFSFSPGFGSKIATRLWVTDDPITGEPLDDPYWVNIGPHVYSAPFDDNAEGTHAYHATSSEGTKWFNRPNDTDHRIKGADVTYPIGQMTLSRQLKTYPELLHTHLMGQRNKINNDNFLTRPPGTLKFVGPQVSSTVGLGQGESPAGVIWNISLSFDDSDEGWFIEIQDTYTDTKGDEVAILREVAGKPLIQFTRYKYYSDISFGAMLGMLEAYA